MRPDPSSNPPRRSARTSRPDKIPSLRQDVASPRSESPSVQDRIRQWQAQGAAEAIAPDNLSVRSLPMSECPSTISRAPSTSAEKPKVRRGRSRKEPEDQCHQVRSQSTPRKRIISDGHWKAKGQTRDPKDSLSPSKPTMGSSGLDLTYTSTGKGAKERRRSRHHPDSVTADSQLRSSPHDDGIRGTPLPDPATQLDSYGPISPTLEDTESRADEDLARFLTTESVCSGDLETRSQSSIQPEEYDSTPRRRSKYVETLGRPPSGPEDGSFSRSKKGKFFGKTKDILFMKSEGGAASNRVPIEAWLEEQPDPFLDQEDRNELPPVEVPQPLKKRSQRRRSSKEVPVTMDPNKIWESVQPSSPPISPQSPELRSDQSRRRKSSNSTRATPPRTASASATNHDEAEVSPSPLRRRGARVRRQRGTSLKDISSEPNIPELLNDIEEQLSVVLEDHPVTLPHRPCPPTGEHRLSTIASVETMREVQPALSAIHQGSDSQCELKRKLTTHEDLLSVLSVPERGRSLRSAKSIRTIRPQKKSTSAHEVLAGLVADEQKYTRELRTLVDGVIPVLLQCVLSKTDSAAAVSLFSSCATSQGDFNFTRPIIDMGIALERLKTLHNRIPFQDIDNLLKWGQSAQKAYTDYLHAWRLGFHDVVVNLAPLENADASEVGLARDELGDAVTADGQKADVAYLLKRPLVRVKALGKTFAHIRDEYEKPQAHKVASAYAELTALAKRRFQEEQARLEDEAAASIDPTRARDIKTLAATTNVVVHQSRRVKARDFFSLTLYHTSGQRVDCGIELIFRDNARGDPVGGDVLVCEVDASGKWLLFEPVELSSISARRGEGGFDLVVMIRGRASFGKEWHELLALKTEDPEAVTEWMAMLGSNPLPPRLNRTSSFISKKQPSATTLSIEDKENTQKQENSPKLNLPIDLDVPIGEPSLLGARTDLSRKSAPAVNKPLPFLNLGGGLVAKSIARYQNYSLTSQQSAPSVLSSDRSTLSDSSGRGTSTVPSSSLGSTSTVQSRPDVKSRPVQSTSPIGRGGLGTNGRQSSEQKAPSALRRTDNESREWMTSPVLERTRLGEHDGDTTPTQIKTIPRKEFGSATASPEPALQRPEYKRALSSTPSKDLPTVSRIRASAQSATAQTSSEGPLLEEDQDRGRRTQNPPTRVTQDRGDNNPVSKHHIVTEDVPTPPPHTSPPARKPLRLGANTRSNVPDSQSTSNGAQNRLGNKPTLDLKPMNSPTDKQLKRRTSSPLKHEYAPSTSSDGSSEYDTESVSDSSSDTSEDIGSEHGDTPTPLVAVFAGGRQSSKTGLPPASVPSTGTRTLAPSDSASQGPYRKVPSSATVPLNKRSKAIALICSWSDRGMWEQIHPDECSIVISPGLIEAFEMSAAHSDPQAISGPPPGKDSDSRTSSTSQQPLVAFELTPIVPLRRGTALDISIRSPPTPNSRIQTTNNVMFRSRNLDECEALYGMINWARCNNPTYIQLQMARPARQPSVTFNVGQTGHSRSRSSSWFSFGLQRKSSYRASSAPTPASIDMSVESSGSMASAFSALKRFTANSAFNVNRSSVLRRPGSAAAAGSLYSSSSGTASGSGSSTPVPSQLGFVPGKDGPNVPSTSAAAADGGGMINMMKIRLYVRKGQHWENLGAARLSVLPVQSTTAQNGGNSGSGTPTRAGTVTDGSPPATPAHGRSPSSVMTLGQPGQSRGPRLPSSSNTPHRIHGNGREKRLLIVKNKDRDFVLLDSVLGESCFERIMQTGIAVKVWNEAEAISHTGGVTMGRETLYMMQFPGTREAGWVFGLCGTYRYGAGLSNE
ncbi:hypothetical protein LTR84_006409 [Exophiala bonariae]|uniref:DH domain-containing protein n=1 Tax=Exophiala bonariae TaxID=1690606 RepID=A0AAV9N153_9EURO|nr:hypothetical protein LTR84_006409 [Exophiala bonariae]